MKPLALIGAILVICAAGAVMLVTRAVAPAITLHDARLIPTADGHALVVTIENPGPPDRLIEVSTSAEGQLMVAGALFSTGLPIPSGASPSLSTDGAHGMLLALEGETREGRLVPVTLRFANAGAVSTRARISGPSGMDHSAEYAVPANEPAPSVGIAATATGDGWRISIEAGNFSFSREAVDGPHQPGVGHAHLFVDGLKLGRIFGTEVAVGALPDGDHEFRVTLNTNDHRVYVVDGLPVTAAARATAD